MFVNSQDGLEINDIVVQQSRMVSELDVKLSDYKVTRYPCDVAKNPSETVRVVPLPFSSELMEFNNFIDLMDFLNQQDLLSYLPVPEEAKKGKAFHCIFHEDITASAVLDCKNDKWKFFCNDSNCNYHQPAGLDIIDITQRMFNMSWSEAVNSLGRHYNFTFKATTEFSRGQMLKLANNKTFLLNNLVKYPNLSRLLSENIDVLLKLIDIASVNIYEDLINVCTDESIFFMSCRFLSEKVDFNYLDVNRILNLYANLGLIEKIPFKLVPKKYAEKSERLATEGQSEGKSMPRIQYFTVNSFEVAAGEAERRASILLTKNFVLSDVSKMYFDRFLGKDITQFTYPDYRYQIELKMTEQTRLVKIAILKNIKLYGFCGFDELRKEKQLALVSTNKLKDSMKNLILVLELQNIKWMKMNKALCSKFGYDKFNYVFCDIKHEEVDISSCNMEDADDIQVYNIQHSDALEDFDDPVPF
ncbi:hypothetical protein JCM17380_16500 [Desulfosporosinus burensis]